MALYLVQHGKSLPKEADPEQGLSEQGQAEVQRIAAVAADYQIRVFEILHSVKKRARQTAEIFATALKPTRGCSERSGLKPMDDITEIAATLNSPDNVMLVGHLPFMEKLTAYLVTGTTDNRVFKFQNGGIVCLDKDAEQRVWFIKWTLMPDIS